MFLAILSTFLIIPAVKEKNEVKLAPAITIRAPTTLTEEIIQTPLLVAERTIKILTMLSNAATYSLNFLLHVFIMKLSLEKHHQI